jgi:antirestriction protein
MSIKIYIACLSSYNNGFLFGKHFNLDQYSDSEELLADIQKDVLDNPENPSRLKYGENPEEWAMHDIEGIDYKHINTEYPDLQKLIDMNEMLSELGESAFNTLLGLKDNMGFDTLSEAKEYYDENLLGEFGSDEEMADYVAEEVNGWDMSEGPARYFDSSAFARDLTTGGDVFEIDGTYFWSR